MHVRRTMWVVVICIATCAPSAQAAPVWMSARSASCGVEPAMNRVWTINWQVPGFVEPLAAPANVSALVLDTPLVDPDQASRPAGRRRTLAVEYSEGYKVRQTIHKYASIATLPLFIAQYAVGQKLYNGNGTDSTRSLHSGLAAGTAVLFGVNTVTGVWNLWEGRKDPNGKNRRMIHGILMLAADAGFAATGIMTPDREGRDNGTGLGLTNSGTSSSTHRTVALTSMGVALASYLMMLLWRD